MLGLLFVISTATRRHPEAGADDCGSGGCDGHPDASSSRSHSIPASQADVIRVAGAGTKEQLWLGRP